VRINRWCPASGGRLSGEACHFRWVKVVDVTVARALHVLAVVLWIGGVGLVTTVVLPALRHMPDRDQRLAVFEAVESRFGKQARISVVVAGLTGLYMLVRMNAWYRFAEPAYWWMHAMVLIWTIFTLMLFFVEPFVLRRRFAGQASTDSNAAFRTLHWVHIVLLVLSLVTVVGAVAGSYGLLLFN